MHENKGEISTTEINWKPIVVTFCKINNWEKYWKIKQTTYNREYNKRSIKKTQIYMY